ncbi:LacI family DNA-binding transcriptional regulator [Pseudonocardia sp. MH-G8]|uniref:LacI family DNA-binding transcriptional regulator n=1 Tax=Pseudonocardia sp. MH-G8 TaxID=1854588 RepID=UPI000BA09C6F|nr:LacI family DNA-binding transcriptional regulator [Pseudonocardia sp. MH-G8]OZM75804.1 LacI family transcriptional regulator [Pseudonocardia sp. MH-G8]
MSGKRTPTLVDVAREAGVSPATASRVLNGSARAVGEPHRGRVTDAAARLGYVANTSAQELARGGSDFVALILTDLTDPQETAIAAGVVEEADRRGLFVTVSVTNGRPGRELELLHALRAQRPAAVVLAGHRATDVGAGGTTDALTDIRAGGGGVAIVGDSALPFDRVVPQNYEGARDLAVRLGGLGYESAAVLAGPSDDIAARDRTRGFVDGCAAAGVRIGAGGVVHGELSRAGGHAAALHLLALDGPRADVVLAVADTTALGAMVAIRDSGLAVPDDVSLAGFDDIDALRDVSPGLTTVRLPLRELGVTAVRVALSAPSAAPAARYVGARPVLRDSTPARRHQLVPLD